MRPQQMLESHLRSRSGTNSPLEERNGHFRFERLASHLKFLPMSVLIRISFRQQTCYRCLFLYDDAHDTIGRSSRLEALSSRLTNHWSLATRHCISNRHTAQFKSSPIPLKTKGTRNSNSHSERCFGIHPVERTAENRRDAGVTKGREPTGRRKKSKPYGAS